jgi:hypothetical protein
MGREGEWIKLAKDRVHKRLVLALWYFRSLLLEG